MRFYEVYEEAVVLKVSQNPLIYFTTTAVIGVSPMADDTDANNVSSL